MNKRNTAILLFDDVEVLDFAGPFEIFSVTNELNDDKLFQVYTVSLTRAAVRAKNGLSVNADYSLGDCPAPDVLILPGGVGTRKLLEVPVVIDWVRACAAAAEQVLSVCTGSLLLARAGLLEGLKATTHHRVFDLLAELAPRTEILKGQRFVDNGRIVTSAGVSAGLDASLHVVGQLCGPELARRTAAYIEYEGFSGDTAKP